MFRSIPYDKLNARQKENYNFTKISAILADYGFVTMRLSDDWNGADFIAQHVDGTFLRVQLKTRLCFDKKYYEKDLYVAFREGDQCFLYPHDELLERALAETEIENTASWEGGSYHFPRISEKMRALLERYKVGGDPPIPQAETDP